MTNSILDPVKISNKFAVFSNQPNDLIFNKRYFNKPFFCAGIVKEIGPEVYNYKIGDTLGYFSPNQELEIEISSNLAVEIPSENNYRLIFLLPYAVLAMNILRRTNPKLGDTVLLIGKNFFNNLLKELFTCSGAEVFIASKEVDEHIPPIINMAFISPEPNENTDFLKKFKIRKKHELNQFNIYDGGLDDPNYLRGIKYPYSYVRWYFKTNLSYFFKLILENKINLDFFQVIQRNVSSVDNLIKDISSLKKDSLILFTLQN